MKKIIFIILTLSVALFLTTGCVKRVEVKEHNKTVTIPEESKPHMEKAVETENEVKELKEKIKEKESSLSEAKENYEEAKENEADLDKLKKIKNAKGKLW